MDFSGKVVLITGASRGIGRATALQFAAQNARVAVHYHVNKDAAGKTLAALPGQGHQIFQANIAEPGACKNLVAEVLREMGKIHILVNNAGIFQHHPVPEVDFEEWLDAWERTIGTNLFGPAHITYHVARQMLKTGGGRIVNISSRGAFRGEPDAPAYGASKAGLNAMSQSLAKALAPHNIFVYAIAPGWVETAMARPYVTGPQAEEIKSQSPLHRVARPEEIARTVLFLASEGSEFMTGAIVDINGASYLRT